MVEAGRDVELKVRTEPSGIVEGSVVGDNGEAMPGTLVYLQPRTLQCRSAGNSKAELTDRRRRYRHMGVQAGSFSLSVAQDGKQLIGTDPFECKPREKVERVLTVR